VLGRRFDEIRVMPFDEWTTAFIPGASPGSREVQQLPLVVALRRATPDHGHVEIVGGDGVARTIAVTAFPILGPHDRLIGAVAMFWETAGT
jgi:hypothetical protein